MSNSFIYELQIAKSALQIAQQQIRKLEAMASTHSIHATHLPEAYRATAINDCGLSIRTRNALVRANIKTLGDLVDTDLIDLRAIKNFGDTCVNEIAAYLASVSKVKVAP